MDYATIDQILGYPGRMLSGSKQIPSHRQGHVIYWNACVFVKTGRKDADQIWYGDLDVTADEVKFQELANALSETIYVTPEQPWRFNGFRETMKVRQNRDRLIQFDPQ